MSKPLEDFKQFFASQPNPDQVGESEYRLVYDFVQERLEDGEDPDVLCASLKQFEESVKLFQRGLDRG